MMKKLIMLPIKLRLFDGQAAPAAPGAQTTDANSTLGGSHQATKGDNVKVVYGKQPNEVNTTDTSQAATDNNEQKPLTPEERKAQFEALISGEYKDAFSQRVQSIIDKRFKEAKTIEAQYKALKPALDILMDKYNVKDPSKLTDAIMNDVEFLEQLADAKGMTVEQFKRMRQLEAENEQLRLRTQTAEAQIKVDEQVAEWYRQADELRGTKENPGLYPDFDLRAETQNPQFLSLLKAGIDVKTAYEVVHMDDIKNTIAKTTAKKVENNVTANIQAKGMRPVENGVNNNSGVIVKSDVRQLTKKDRAEIARRAQMGDTITF